MQHTMASKSINGNTELWSTASERQTSISRWTIKDILDTIRYSKSPDGLEGESSIIKVTPLRRQTSQRREQAEHHSIVLYTNDPIEADKCIKHGIYINYHHFDAHRYTPQLQITQCFNCHEYGHIAAHCKRKRKCGKCADEGHDTKDCKSKELKCVQCKAKHEAWHHECPRRLEERLRLEEVKSETSPYHTL